MRCKGQIPNPKIQIPKAEVKAIAELEAET